MNIFPTFIILAIFQNRKVYIRKVLPYFLKMRVITTVTGHIYFL